MNKDKIKKYIKNTFLSEDSKHVALSDTEAIQKKSKKHNDDAQKEIGKKMKKYTDGSKSDKNSEDIKKYDNTDSQDEFHDEYETLNGLEMLKFDNEPSDSYKERALKAIEGHASMGNGPGANAEATWGASSDTFGKDLVKRIKGRVKKEEDAIQYDGMGDVAVPRGKNKKNKPVAVSENTNKDDKNINKMKRLKFKKPFNGFGNALNLIPENYKVDNKTFQMTDGDELYEIRWEGTINEGSAVILKAESKTMVNEDMAHIKKLMGYNSRDTFGTLKGTQRINENKTFNTILNKSKAIINESNSKKNVISEDFNLSRWAEKMGSNNEGLSKIRDLFGDITNEIDYYEDENGSINPGLIEVFGNFNELEQRVNELGLDELVRRIDGGIQIYSDNIDQVLNNVNENATGVAGMGFKSNDKVNPKEVKPGSEKGYANGEGPMVMNEDDGIDQSYTHFAVFKSDGKIATGWDYSDTDKEDIKEFSKYDLKDDFPDNKVSEFKIVTKKGLEKQGINPFDSDNWYKIESDRFDEVFDTSK